MNKFFKISNIKLGFGYEPVLIVDLGINHNGNLDKAIYLSDLAIKNGAKIIISSKFEGGRHQLRLQKLFDEI